MSTRKDHRVYLHCPGYQLHRYSSPWTFVQPIPTQLIANQVGLAYRETKTELADQEIENHLQNDYLGKDLDITTERGYQSQCFVPQH